MRALGNKLDHPSALARDLVHWRGPRCARLANVVAGCEDDDQYGDGNRDIEEESARGTKLIVLEQISAIVDVEHGRHQRETAHKSYDHTPQRPPDAVTEQLLISDKNHHHRQNHDEPSHLSDIVDHVHDHEQGGAEHLDKESLWQGVASIARGKAEDVVDGDDEELQQYQREHVRVGIEPLQHSAQVVAGRREHAVDMDVEPVEHGVDIGHLLSMTIDHAVDSTREKIDDHTQHTDEHQHLDRRETHLPLAADVVADEIARPQEKLHNRVEH